jgi:hypothetical protein
VLLKRALAGASSLLIVAIGAVALTACPEDTPPPVEACTLAFIGDKSKPVQLEITARDVAGKAVPVKEGDDVPMIYPPQGGRVVFVGARVTNIDPCAMKLSGAIRDPTTAQVRIDNRTVNLVPGSDGFGTTLDVDISTFSNVPVCPNQWASDDVFDKPYELQVTVLDRGGRTATQKVKVVPRCAEPERAAECRCICRKDYMLGQACDAGVDAGSDGGDDSAADADAGADVSPEGGG